MQIKNDNRKSFKPVSVVFETYEEYKAFKDFINETHDDIERCNIHFDCDTDIVYEMKNELDNEG